MIKTKLAEDEAFLGGSWRFAKRLVDQGHACTNIEKQPVQWSWSSGLPYPEIGAYIFQIHARIFLAKIHLDAPGQSRLPCKSGFHLGANSLDGHALRQLLQGGQILVRLPAR